MKRWSVALAATAAVLVLVSPTPAEAQLGALKRRVQEKVAERVLGPEKAAAAGLAQGPVFDERVLEITPAVLDRLQTGLAAEQAALRSAEADGSARARWEQCVDGVDRRHNAEMEQLNREGEALAARAQAAAGKPEEMAELVRAVQALQARAAALQTGAAGAQHRECGEEPVAAPRSPAAAGEAAGEFTDAQYAVLKERARPFCEAAAQGRGGSHGSYVYAADEAAALAPRCTALLPALQAVM